MGFTKQIVNSQHGKIKPLYAVLICLLVLSVGFYLLSKNSGASQKPLYWVAPMDPNYRRDEPGKSPMGMDLVPVYEEDLNGNSSDNPGAVFISPALQQKISVKTTQVEKGTLKQTAMAFGRVAYNTEQRQIMTSPTVAKIDYVVTSYTGEKVLKGLPLYALSSDQLIRAQENYLKALNGTNRQALIETEQRLQNLGFDEKLIAELKRDGAAQENVVYRAPISGVVTQLKAAQGTYVSTGFELMTIQPLDTVWVILEIPLKYADAIAIGNMITLTSSSASDRKWQGKIDFIYPDVDPKSQSLKVRSTLKNNSGQLKPNMFLSATIDLPSQTSALLVPYQSVIRLGNSNRVVLALGDGFFKSVNVTLGRENSEWIEITSGLEEGDEIVVSAQFLIDSESSKTSDFQRFEQAKAKIRRAEATAVIKDIWREERKLRLEHSPIEAWNMSSMTMNFLAEAEVDLNKVKMGDEVKIKIKDDPEQPLYIIEDIQPQSSQP